MSVFAGSRIVMIAGGTGGHVYPALAVAKALRERGCDVHWVGTANGLEASVVPAAGLPLHCLAVRGVRGKGLWHKVTALLALGVAVVQALGLLLRLSPRCVIGMGGYVAAPAGFAAWVLRKPLLIHEQNAVAGTTNRLLAPLAYRVLTAFDGAFGKRATESIGNPVRLEILAAGGQSHYDYQGQRPLRLLVVGGSLGAQALNEVVPDALSALCAERGDNCVDLHHQTGPLHIDKVRASYGDAHNKDWRINPYIDDMAQAYQWADVVLCRAGALTVSELAVMGRPSLLVPLPHAIDDHQRHNAKALTDVGAAILMEQSELTPALLAKQLASFIANPKQLQQMSRAARAAAHTHATERVVQLCEEACCDV